MQPGLAENWKNGVDHYLNISNILICLLHLLICGTRKLLDECIQNNTDNKCNALASWR
jgi:hypothetical protein